MTKKQRLTSLFLFGIVASPAVTYSAQFEFVPGSSKKICQLIGDVDLQFGTPTISQTLTRAGVSGTDLGFSFEHNGKLYFLFGDTQPGPNLNREILFSIPKMADIIRHVFHILPTPVGTFPPAA
jgi:hypothetical protein